LRKQAEGPTVSYGQQQCWR